MSVAIANPGARARWWRKWRFHLSALVILVPAVLAPSYFQRVATRTGAAGLGAHEIGALQVGPWTVRLAELDLAPPEIHGAAGPVKSFTLAMQGDAVEQVRAAYLKIGKPRSLRAAGWIFFGSPYRQTAGLAVPERTAPEAEIWLTLEGWDGSVHQASLKLAEASPTTVLWLNAKRGEKP